MAHYTHVKAPNRPKTAQTACIYCNASGGTDFLETMRDWPVCKNCVRDQARLFDLLIAETAEERVVKLIEENVRLRDVEESLGARSRELAGTLGERTAALEAVEQERDDLTAELEKRKTLGELVNEFLTAAPASPAKTTTKGSK